jgi:hypothetical protein
MEQSNTNFTWILYFDPATPAPILKKVAFLLNAPVKTELRFADNYDSMLADLRKTLHDAPSQYVITSRLDNDDLISRHFISDVQKSFKPHHATFINFNAGYEYSLHDCVLKKWNVRPHNQFISIVEEAKAMDLQSIYGFPHWKIPENAEVIDISGEPHWIYLRHGLNYSGSAITGIPCFFRPKYLALFPGEMRNARLSFAGTLHYSLRWLPKMVKRKMKM